MITMNDIKIIPVAWRLPSPRGLGNYQYTEYDTTVEYWEKTLVELFGQVEPLYSQETVDQLQVRITELESNLATR